MVDVDKRICNYIAREWIKPAVSNRSFALDHGIDEKIVRKIVGKEGYRIPVNTLFKICEARELKMYTFFERLVI